MLLVLVAEHFVGKILLDLFYKVVVFKLSRFSHKRAFPAILITVSKADQSSTSSSPHIGYGFKIRAIQFIAGRSRDY